MNEDSIKKAQQDIEDALKTVELIEETITKQDDSKDSIKKQFIVLSEKLNRIEELLKKEGIL